MKVLLDTHALLWFLKDAEELSLTAKLAIEDGGNQCFVSMATGWEIAIKTGLGKLAPPIPIRHLFPGEIERQGFDILPIHATHLHEFVDLPLHHRDPFDRMLAAQALSESLAVIGSDAAFDAYGVRRIW